MADSKFFVHLKFPNGRRQKNAVEVIGGPHRNEGILRENILRPHPKGTVIEKIIPLDDEGNPTDAGVPAEDLQIAFNLPPQQAAVVNDPRSLQIDGLPKEAPPEEEEVKGDSEDETHHTSRRKSKKSE